MTIRIESFDHTDTSIMDLGSFLNLDCEKLGTLLVSDIDKVFKTASGYQRGSLS